MLSTVHVNMLTVDAERVEGALVGVPRTRGEGPDHIAVVPAFSADCLGAAGVPDPALRQNPLAPGDSVVHEEQSESPIIAQGGAEPAAADLQSIGRFQPPGRIRFHTG